MDIVSYRRVSCVCTAAWYVRRLYPCRIVTCGCLSTRASQKPTSSSQQSALPPKARPPRRVCSSPTFRGTYVLYINPRTSTPRRVRKRAPFHLCILTVARPTKRVLHLHAYGGTYHTSSRGEEEQLVPTSLLSHNEKKNHTRM